MCCLHTWCPSTSGLLFTSWDVVFPTFMLGCTRLCLWRSLEHITYLSLFLFLSLLFSVPPNKTCFCHFTTYPLKYFSMRKAVHWKDLEVTLLFLPVQGPCPRSSQPFHWEAAFGFIENGRSSWSYCFSPLTSHKLPRDLQRHQNLPYAAFTILFSCFSHKTLFIQYFYKSYHGTLIYQAWIWECD